MHQKSADELTIPFAQFPGFNLRAASNAAMARLSEIIAGLDLKISDASILIVIQANPGCRQSEIGKALNIVSANLTPKLHKLEERGLVSRIRLDGRTNTLKLTRKGTATATACLNAMKAFEAALSEYLSPIKDRDFNSALKRIAAACSG